MATACNMNLNSKAQAVPGVPPSLCCSSTAALLCLRELWGSGVGRLADASSAKTEALEVAWPLSDSGAEQDEQPGVLALRGQVISPLLLSFSEIEMPGLVLHTQRRPQTEAPKNFLLPNPR